MTVTRPIIFWIAVSAIALMALVLLRQILLPFVVGIASPICSFRRSTGWSGSGSIASPCSSGGRPAAGRRLRRLSLVMLPAIIGEVRFFVEEFPRYVTRLQSLVTDASRPWLHSVMGDELQIEQSSARCGGDGQRLA